LESANKITEGKKLSVKIVQVEVRKKVEQKKLFQSASPSTLMQRKATSSSACLACLKLFTSM
jgi:hypothetical protein